MREAKESIQGKQEWQVEAELDAKATIVTSKRLVKVRKLNRLIGENLKLLYGYRCQICGKLIVDEYGTYCIGIPYRLFCEKPEQRCGGPEDRLPKSPQDYSRFESGL